MSSNHRRQETLSRRAFLRSALFGGAGLTLAACASPATQSPPPVTPTANASATPYPQGDHAIVADVLDYSLSSDGWPGEFGWVTLRLYEARHDGQPVYYIRTDCSDETFARDNGLVWMPLLVAGKEAEFENKLYVFEDGRPPVMRSIPGQEPFLSLFEIVYVSGGQDLVLASVAELKAAAEEGLISFENSEIYVNYPVVKWPGGELPVDTALDSYIGTGQLIQPVNIDDMEVTFKLHEGFPGTRYILTDTSAIDRVEKMHIAPAASLWNTTKYNATDEVFVFANGIPGSGVLGYQPAIFGSHVDSLVSSPFWNHFTVRWLYEENSRLLRSSGEVYDALERGELEKLNGLPETHPNGFVVNCPIVVLADNSTG